MDAYAAGWAERSDTDVPVRFSDGEDESSLTDLADRMLAAFMASDQKLPAEGTIIAIEQPMTGALAQGKRK